MVIYKPGSIIFAPLEGITSALYREVVEELYPDWDYYFTEFLRIPPHGTISSKILLRHLGHLTSKSVLQILAAPTSNIEDNLKQVSDLNVPWLDFNIGCPSNQVNRNQGGAYLLSRPDLLTILLKRIRKNFSGYFSVKMRIGYHDDQLFEELLNIIPNEGVDLITLHARTRDQLYGGIADWSYIKRAKARLKIPVIGNGDLWTKNDLEKMKKTTDCDGLMLGRGALKTPWIACEYKTDSCYNRKFELIKYFSLIKERLKSQNIPNDSSLKYLKSLSPYCFNDLKNGLEIRQKILRSQDVESFSTILKEIEVT